MVTIPKCLRRKEGSIVHKEVESTIFFLWVGQLAEKGSICCSTRTRLPFGRAKTLRSFFSFRVLPGPIVITLWWEKSRPLRPTRGIPSSSRFSQPSTIRRSPIYIGALMSSCFHIVVRVLAFHSLKQWHVESRSSRRPRVLRRSFATFQTA